MFFCYFNWLIWSKLSLVFWICEAQYWNKRNLAIFWTKYEEKETRRRWKVSSCDHLLRNLIEIVKLCKSSVAILVSQILHFVSAKYFGIWLSIWYCSVSHVASRKKSSIFLVCEALVNLVSEKNNFSSWLRRELATLSNGSLVLLGQAPVLTAPPQIGSFCWPLYVQHRL